MTGMQIQYQFPRLTVDCVIFIGQGLVLIRRAHDPFKGEYALPGGFVEVGETVEIACVRETKEETGLDIDNLRLVGVYSDPRRDPRRHTVSVAFLGRVRATSMQAGTDATHVEIVKNWREVSLAFDHRQIIEDAFTLHHSRMEKNQ